MSNNIENLGAQPLHPECVGVPYQQGATASLDPTELSVIALGREVKKQPPATPITEGLA